MRKFIHILLAIIFLTTFNACGGGGGDLPIIGDDGGGGDSDDGNPADVSLKASPTKLDTGDIIRVAVRITGVEGRFQVKVKYPKQLKFINGSEILQGDGNPGPNKADFSSFITGKRYHYTIFPFYVPGHFGPDGKGTLTFTLQALGKVTDSIEVDTDELDLVNGGTGFDPEDPRFSPLDEVRIEVKG